MQNYTLPQFFYDKIYNCKSIGLFVLRPASFTFLVGVNTSSLAAHQQVYLSHEPCDLQINLKEQKRCCETSISNEDKYRKLYDTIKTVTEPTVKHIESDSGDFADNQ